MPNPESFNSFSSSAETGGESAKINQARGQKANEAFIESGAGDSIFQGISREEFISKDVSKMSLEEQRRAYRELLEMKAKLEQEAAAPATPETPAPVAREVAAPAAETVSAETARATLNRTKENPQAKGWFSKKAIAIGLGVAILAGATGGYFIGHSTAPSPDNNQGVAEQVIGGDENFEKETIGIKDGYGEKGMWLSEKKTSQNAFTSAEEVAEVCDNDECEMMKYAADNQVESFADYLANLPEEEQPEGFKGLSILETEKKLESLSDEEYEAIQKQYNGTMDRAFTRRVTVNGEKNNAYMRHKGGDVVHENMELVKCTTNESNLEVTEFYWLDENGNEIGSMMVKMTPVYDENGNIVGFKGCMQVISDKDSPVYDGLDEIPDPEPGTGSESTGNEGTGSEGTGSEDTGSEGTGSEGTGSEGTGSEGTGSEGTDIKPKDSENLQRIDEKIDKEIEKDIGTKEIKHNPNPGVSEKEKTEKPSGSDYEGTKPKTVQNETSKPAEKVEPKKQENNYSEDKGGKNSSEYAPVKENKEAQKKADESETKVKDAPTSKQEVNDALSDLGID
ncbi:hypothetical protein J6X04_00865 [Candidatus Saccharibacteria bacterium]|nr:hypothetical protein [Candidatus Saccharibacteria bacterium]